MASNRLRCLHLGEPLGPQMARRRGINRVASAILAGLIGFILAIFASFGRADLGLLVGGTLFGVPLGWIWWDYRGLQRAVERYERRSGANPDDKSPS